jgi:hypothetical protein
MGSVGAFERRREELKGIDPNKNTNKAVLDS